jgi:hypothetical protein
VKRAMLLISHDSVDPLRAFRFFSGFHARLVDGMVVIETDNIEEGLKTAMIEAGIRAEGIVWGYKHESQQVTPIAA